MVQKNLSKCFFVFIIASFIVVALSDSESDSDLIRDLVSLRSASDSGVIRLNEDGVSRFITSVPIPRPYFLLIFFDAAQLQLQEFRREFRIVSASFIANNNGSNGTKLFFCDIESEQSASSFHLFGIESLPHIYLVDPSMESLEDKSGQMEVDDDEGLAKTMVEFVERRTKLTVGPIHRPPLLSKTKMSLLVALIIISTPILIKMVRKGETLIRDQRIWLSGAIIVYFFSVSGTMHNIIKGVPIYEWDYDDTSKLVFFYEGPDMQLGTEAFSVGFMFTVVGLLLAYVTNVLVRVKSLTEQSLMMFLSMFLSFSAVKLVLYWAKWKTDYEIYPYWPSSWL